jgi:hypothetical protein
VLIVIQSVILSLPEPLSERSERKAAEDGEGSQDALLGVEAQQRFVIGRSRLDSCSDQPDLFACQPIPWTVDLRYRNHSLAPAPSSASGDPNRPVFFHNL